MTKRRNMNVNFEYYKIFYYVAKYKNFTKAAHALGSGQPNVTRAMNCLEQEIRCTLFIRTNRGVKLTPEGEQLFRHVAVAMAQLQAAETELTASMSLEEGSISIGASETALNVYLLDKLSAFHAEHPGIRLKIYNHSTPQAIRSVKNGEIDFAVVSTPTNAETPLKQIPVQVFRDILVGGRTFAELGSRELQLSELQDYPLICLGRQTMTWRFYHDLFLSHGLELAPDTEVATADQILPLVKSDLGLAFIPESMALEALRQKKIVRIGLREEIPERQICMVYDRQHPLSAAAQRLKSEILENRVPSPSV